MSWLPCNWQYNHFSANIQILDPLPRGNEFWTKVFVAGNIFFHQGSSCVSGRNKVFEKERMREHLLAHVCGCFRIKEAYKSQMMMFPLSAPGNPGRTPAPSPRTRGIRRTHLARSSRQQRTTRGTPATRAPGMATRAAVGSTPESSWKPRSSWGRSRGAGSRKPKGS